MDLIKKKIECIKNGIIVPDNEEDVNNNSEVDNENKNNTEKIGDVELPPIFNNVNPIFDTKLDIVGKSKKNKIYNKKK